ncbi:hypothetical protein SAMN04489806_2517 [Paramicrobacterium humi]|uniref:Tetratricopeptide repeat-containing protein n=1 Tax=Paramicrobacterium humi TaxID=640635 RepID=A0A1H4PJB6_9MICO|nr:hypothetical protein [Microbacterium humi]SEC07162.1 hypothetical protein SAMN04489806_2517 [Microbacterium humi]
MPERRTARRRMRLALATLPLVLVALVFAGKLFSLPVIVAQGAGDYESGQWKNAAQSFDRLDFWNAFEPWVAHFDQGTALAAAGSFTRATDELWTALQLAPADRRCQVRVNLALAWEQQGDSYAKAGSVDGAVRLWQAALAVIEDGKKEGCFEPQDTDADKQLKSAEQRLLDKLKQNGGTEDGAPPGEDQSGDQNDRDSGDGNAFDELEKRGKDAEREKQNGDAGRRGDSGGSGGTDKPW